VNFNFTKKYIFALMLLGVLSTLGYLNLNILIELQSNDSKTINLSGKQRMLSQRIYSSVVTSKIEVLEKSLRLMEKSHQYLTSLPMSKEVHTIYYEEPLSFDKKVKEYIAKGLKIKGDINDINTLHILEYSDNLLKIFDKLTFIYQDKSEKKVKKLKEYELYIYISSLLVLCLIGFLIFRPANKKFEIREKEIISEKDYSNIIIESNTNAIIAVGKDLKVKTFNRAAEKIFGYSKEEMIGKDSLLKIVPSMQHMAHSKGIANHFKTGIFKHKSANLELEAVKKNGELFPIRISFGEDIYAPEQERIVIANIQDISIEKEKEKLLHTNEKIYQDLFELNQSIILLINPTSGNIVNANKSAVNFYGYEKSKLLTLNISDINTLPIDKIEEEMNRAIKNEKVYFEFIHVLSDNQRRNVRVTSTPTWYKGEIVLYATIVDRTEELDAKIKLLSLAEEFKDYSELSKLELEKMNVFLNEGQKVANIGNWEYDLMYEKLVWSSQVYKIFNLNPNEFEPSYENFFKYVHPDDIKKIEDTYNNSLKENKPYFVEHRIVRTDGSIRYVEESGTHKKNSNNEIVKSIGIIHDITEKKLAQLKLREQEKTIVQQSKMAAMGEMIENIAHQWRQPLSVVSTAATGIKFKEEMDLIQEGDIQLTMNTIENSVQHLSQTINDFRDFFKTNKKQEKFVLGTTFEKTFKLLVSQFKTSNITIIKNIVDVDLFGLEHELIQVLINLLNNARDELIKKEQKVKLILIDTSITSNTLEIYIQDNAGGIPNDIISEVFESHFTTKHESNGTGIGLYMSKMIIEEHMSGTIEVSNIEFKYEGKSYDGAQFKIILPLLSEK